MVTAEEIMVLKINWKFFACEFLYHLWVYIAENIHPQMHSAGKNISLLPDFFSFFLILDKDNLKNTKWNSEWWFPFIKGKNAVNFQDIA